MMDINILVPISENKTVIRYFYYFKEKDYNNEEFINNAIKNCEDLQDEDTKICI
jgi:hypothetical protein